MAAIAKLEPKGRLIILDRMTECSESNFENSVILSKIKSPRFDSVLLMPLTIWTSLGCDCSSHPRTSATRDGKFAQLRIGFARVASCAESLAKFGDAVGLFAVGFGELGDFGLQRAEQFEQFALRSALTDSAPPIFASISLIVFSIMSKRNLTCVLNPANKITSGQAWAGATGQSPKSVLHTTSSGCAPLISLMRCCSARGDDAVAVRHAIEKFLVCFLDPVADERQSGLPRERGARSLISARHRQKQRQIRLSFRRRRMSIDGLHHVSNPARGRNLDRPWSNRKSGRTKQFRRRRARGG